MKKENLDDLIVVKRSGQRVKFNASKIAIAIKKAFESVYEENNNEGNIFIIFEKVLNYINENYKGRKTITVEDIQDIIEKILNESKYNDVFLSFTEYRKKRAATRQAFPEKQQHKFMKTVHLLEEFSYEKNNSIMPYQLFQKIGGIISGEYSKIYLLDNKYVRLLEDGSIYINNLNQFSMGLYTHYNFKENYNNKKNIYDLFDNIFKTSEEINGIINISNFNLKISSFIKNEFQNIISKNIYKIYSCFGIDKLFTQNNIQKKISNIYDIDDIYSLFDDNDGIMEFVNKKITELSINDLNEYIDEIFISLKKRFIDISNNNIIYDINISSSKSKIDKLINENIFCLINTNNIKNINYIFNINEESTREYINKIILLESNNKNIYFNFNKNYSVFSDGICFNNNNEEGKLLVSSTSINVARIALKSNCDKNVFYKELDDLFDHVKNQLIFVYEYLGNRTINNYNYLFKGNVFEDEKLEENQKIRKVIKAGYLGIGLIGLYEASSFMINEKDNRIDFISKLLQHLQEKCEFFEKENKIKFILYEETGIKSREEVLKIDKSIYGIINDITDKEKYSLLSQNLNNISEIKMIKENVNYGFIYYVKKKKIKNMVSFFDELIKLQINLVKFVDDKED